MKSVVLTGVRKFELREFPTPDLENEAGVLIKVGAVGLCGSDVHYYLRDRVGDQTVSYPWILGHECAGVIQEVGGNVEKVKPGDRVAVDPAFSCGRCDQCVAGRPHTCRNLRFLGYPGQLKGCLSEFICVPEANCHLIPDNMTMTQAALVEPLSIGIYSVGFLDRIGTQPIGILGSGPIGLSVLRAARATGAGSVYVTDKIKERLKAACSAGATWVGNPSLSDIVKDVIDNEPLGLDAVFECCGDQAALDQAVELLKPGGRLLILGIPWADRVSFDISRLRRKEISVQNVRRQHHCFPSAIELISNHRAEVDSMVTHTFDLAETQAAFELLSDYKDGVIKAMVLLD
jgi:L-iditol 2-dehydrogenase